MIKEEYSKTMLENSTFEFNVKEGKIYNGWQNTKSLDVQTVQPPLSHFCIDMMKDKPKGLLLGIVKFFMLMEKLPLAKSLHKTFGTIIELVVDSSFSTYDVLESCKV